jgi:hypothetical protein
MSVPLPSYLMRVVVLGSRLVPGCQGGKEDLGEAGTREPAPAVRASRPGLLAEVGGAEEAPSRDVALPVVWREILWRGEGVAGIRGEAGGAMGGKWAFGRFT